MKLSCVVIEDEEAARQKIVQNLEHFPEIEIVGEAAFEQEAFNLILETQPDAAFLDVELKKGNAFSLLERLKAQNHPIPNIIMITGKPEYAVDALNDFKANIVQYLVKPYLEDKEIKFRKAIDALMAAKLSGKPNIHDVIHLRNKREFQRVEFNKIAYLEANGEGGTLVVNDKNYYSVNYSLTKFMKILPSNHFIRISNQNVVRKQRIVSVNSSDRTLVVECLWNNNPTLRIGGAYYDDLKNLLLNKT